MSANWISPVVVGSTDWELVEKNTLISPHTSKTARLYVLKSNIPVSNIFTVLRHDICSLVAFKMFKLSLMIAYCRYRAAGPRTYGSATIYQCQRRTHTDVRKRVGYNASLLHHQTKTSLKPTNINKTLERSSKAASCPSPLLTI